jgi:hypothetical protein
MWQFLGNSPRNLVNCKLERASFLYVRLGGDQMLRTITIGSCVSVQGTFVRALADGRIAVRVGNQIFAGIPVVKQAA